MKRKWSLRLGAAVLCAVLLGSCGSTAAAPAESTAPADPLTGQQLLYPEQRAAAVVIENTTDSTTQWGIGSASVVLEAMTESGSSTELCLVYPALSAMPVVGPVTRGQDLYWRLLSGQQVLPIQCGSNAYAKRYLEYYNLRAVDAQEVGRNAFVSTGYSWDNTPLWRTSGKAVAAVLDSLSISTAVNQNTASGSESETAGVLPALLPQRDTGHLPDANAADAVKATVNFQSGGATGFVYDDALAAYGMLHADGTPQLDANTGTQAVFDNLLILYSGSSLRDDGRTLDYDLSMGGGVWLNGGHLWQITWTQGTQSTLALYDSNGKPLNLPAGRSYIALLSSLTGQELLVQLTGGSYTFRIVGVYKYEQSAFSFSTASDKDISTSLYIPLSTAKQLVGADRGFSNITVQAALGESSTEVAAEVKNYLSRYYRTNENYTVTAISMDTMISSVDSMMSTLSVAISVIAGISLLVGGIGVMNIMLVSVTERTREIGTRKALGATNNNIRLQFVVESVIICLIGGAIGIVLGAIMGYVGSGLLKNAVLPSIGAIVLAFTFSLAVGVFFGYYPANKAAKMDPIEALRYE